MSVMYNWKTSTSIRSSVVDQASSTYLHVRIMYLNMLFQILWTLEALTTEVTLVRLQWNVNTNV